MTDANELREEAQAVSFWLDEKNSQARKELEQRNPPLGQWLSMVERKVSEKLAQVEKEQEVQARA
jgi:hypothetical protein